jgi:hypothetical protein
MSQTILVAAAEYPPTPAARAKRRIAVRSTRRIKQPRPLPALNWPADLFADNATIGELVSEDFAFPPHISAALFGHQSPEGQALTSH